MRLVKEFTQFILYLFRSKALLFVLIKNNFKKQYLGSYLGLASAYIQPFMFMLVIWTVFEFGFRTGPTATQVPFALWLLAGMVPWFFISDTISSGVDAVVGNAFLVRKVAFRVSILPLVSIGTSFLVHQGLVLFLIIALLLNGYWPTMYWLQLPFFMILAIMLSIGLTWLTSAIRVFVNDVTSVIGVLMQIGFWATPIFWPIDLVHEKYHYLIKLNPAYYIIDGYRDSFIGNTWFWEKPSWTIYYLGGTSLLLIIGALAFKRLRPHFADVL